MTLAPGVWRVALAAELLCFYVVFLIWASGLPGPAAPIFLLAACAYLVLRLWRKLGERTQPYYAPDGDGGFTLHRAGLLEGCFLPEKIDGEEILAIGAADFPGNVLEWKSHVAVALQGGRVFRLGPPRPEPEAEREARELAAHLGKPVFFGPRDRLITVEVDEEGDAIPRSEDEGMAMIRALPRFILAIFGLTLATLPMIVSEIALFLGDKVFGLLLLGLGILSFPIRFAISVVLLGESAHRYEAWEDYWREILFQHCLGEKYGTPGLLVLFEDLAERWRDDP